MSAHNFVNLKGQKFGRLTVIKRSGRDGRGFARWETVCECGKSHFVSSNELRSGDTKSCGCIKRQQTIERNTTHGDSASFEHKCWRNAKNRCHNPRNKSYPDYGGRGIVMCDRWRYSFELFLEDMGRKPSRKHSIERIDNNGNYEPGNCRWATQGEQNNNQRSNHLVTWNGRTMNLALWAAELGIRRGTVAQRLQRGWPVQRAFTTPV